jgi:hypothetical protein
VFAESSICLDTKETKNIHGLLLIFGIHESSISSLNIFKDKIIEQIFSIMIPAARVSHSTRGLFPIASAQILTVILDLATIRAIRGRFHEFIAIFCIHDIRFWRRIF